MISTPKERTLRGSHAYILRENTTLSMSINIKPDYSRSFINQTIPEISTTNFNEILPTNFTNNRYFGILHILGHEHFDDQNLEQRKGVENDVKRLTETFEKMNYKVIPHIDYNLEQISTTLEEIKNTDFANATIVAVAISSHGGEGGKIYSKDKPYFLKDIVESLSHNISLTTKMKIILSGPCRGPKDPRNELDLYNGSLNSSIKQQYSHITDITLHFSTSEEYSAYFNTTGSLYFLILCKLINTNGRNVFFEDILQLVHDKISEISGKRQLTEIFSTITEPFFIGERKLT